MTDKPVGIAASIARKEWEEHCRRRDHIFAKWDEAAEHPTPEGHKRCMRCYETMPWEENCECLTRVSEEIRTKASLFCAALSEHPPANHPTRKKRKKNDERQGTLFQ